MSTTGERGAAAELAAAHEEREALRESLSADGVDPDRLEAVADAYRRVTEVLDRWEERATDWDDFEGYLEFRNDFADTLEAIPGDLPVDDAFVEADGHVKTESVSTSLNRRDFEAAREALAPAREYAERREELRAAEERYREARSAARRRKRELEERISDLERLQELGAADLEAPVGELRDPIERYDGAVETAFGEFRRDGTAREVLGFLETAAGTPLVGYRAPPEALLSYVRETPAGDHTLGELLEYADYSASKLDHYVEAPDRLKRRVATNRTYLEGVDADPLQVGWPPPSADRLRFRAGELVSLVARFADEETVAALRSVAALPRRADYGRLRDAAVARAELSAEERRRVESGAVESDLAAAREELADVREALETYA